MRDQSRPLALLRDANPVHVDPATVRSPQATVAFERIVSEPRDPRPIRHWGRASTRPWSSRRPRARLAISGIGIVAVTAAVVVVAVSGSTAGPAFAGWSAKPTPLRGSTVAALIRRCGLHAPVLVEARGPFTAAVFAAPSCGTACIEGPSVSFVAAIGGVRAPENPVGADQIQTAVASGKDAHGHAFVLLVGRVGSAVRSVVIHRSNHVNVVASIQDGWYLAWWPARAHATHATVSTTDGVHNTALPSLATSVPMSCGGRPGTACAAVQAGSEGSAGVPGPPLILGPVVKPFGDTVLLGVDNARKVLVCFDPPADLATALAPNGPTGRCINATHLTRIPESYPVQRNLLELFPNSIWKVQTPTGAGEHGALRFLVIAYEMAGRGQQRNEFTVNR